MTTDRDRAHHKPGRRSHNLPPIITDDADNIGASDSDLWAGLLGESGALVVEPPDDESGAAT
jgi:hypothetical protein